MARASLKDRIRSLLETGDLDQVAEEALTRRRVLGQLVSLTFDSDPLIVYRAIEAVGTCALRLAPRDPDSIRELLRRLLWLITEESGGICWHAPEMIAVIVRQLPELFEDYLEVAASFLVTMEPEDLEHFRPAALRALGLLGGIPERLQAEIMPVLEAALGSTDPQSRGMAVWTLGELGETAAIGRRTGLLSDSAEVLHYRAGELQRPTVAELARAALSQAGSA
jgi:hypothetical protein